MYIPQKFKDRTPIYSSNLMPRYPKELKAGSQRDGCPPMPIAAIFTRTKTWEQLGHPWAEEWKSKMWYIHTMHILRLKKEGDSSASYSMDEA